MASRRLHNAGKGIEVTLRDRGRAVGASAHRGPVTRRLSLPRIKEVPTRGLQDDLRADERARSYPHARAPGTPPESPPAEGGAKLAQGFVNGTRTTWIVTCSISKRS